MASEGAAFSGHRKQIKTHCIQLLYLLFFQLLTRKSITFCSGFALSVIFGTENFLFILCADVSRLKPPEIFIKIASPLSSQTILPYILLTPFSPKLLWYGGLRRFDFSRSVIWLRASVSGNLCFSNNRDTLAHRIKKTLKGAKISVIVNSKFGDS